MMARLFCGPAVRMVLTLFFLAANRSTVVAKRTETIGFPGPFLRDGLLVYRLQFCC